MRKIKVTFLVLLLSLSMSLFAKEWSKVPLDAPIAEKLVTDVNKTLGFSGDSYFTEQKASDYISIGHISYHSFLNGVLRLDRTITIQDHRLKYNKDITTLAKETTKITCDIKKIIDSVYNNVKAVKVNVTIVYALEPMYSLDMQEHYCEL